MKYLLKIVVYVFYFEVLLWRFEILLFDVPVYITLILKKFSINYQNKPNVHLANMTCYSLNRKIFKAKLNSNSLIYFYPQTKLEM